MGMYSVVQFWERRGRCCGNWWNEPMMSCGGSCRTRYGCGCGCDCDCDCVPGASEDATLVTD